MSALPPTFVEHFHDRAAVQQMKYNRLGTTELRVSELSVGGVALGGLYGAFDREECLRAFDLAVRSGVNLIDSAPWYGQGRSESFIRDALRDVPADAVYLATKVGRYQPDYERMFDFSGARTHSSALESLERLGVNAVHLMQAHDIEFCPDLATILEETLPALQELKEAGITKYIGITGYPVSVLAEVVRRSKVRVDTVLSYCRNNLHDDTLQTYLPFFRARGVGVVDAGVMSMGLLAPQGPPSWHPASDLLKSTTKELAAYCQSQGSSLTQLAARYFLTREGVATHLMGITSCDQLRHNVDLLRQPITAQDAALTQRLRDRFASLPASDRHWEGTEVARYRAAMGWQR